MSCGITHASIGGGDDCVLVILVECGAKYTEYSHRPFGVFPVVIRGKYDSYGRIENIKETPGTKLIEQAFEMTIKEFADLLTDNRGLADSIGNYTKYMRPEVVEWCKDYSKPNLVPKALEIVGFVPAELDWDLITNKPPPKAGETWWTHPEVDSVLVRLSHWVSASGPVDRNPKQMDHLWEAFEVRKNCPWTEENKFSLNSLVIAWESGHKLLHLLDCIYKAKGRHLAYPEEAKTLLHRFQMLDHVWIHGSAWDVFSNPMKDDGGKLSKWYGDDWSTHGVKPSGLEMLGFVLDEEASIARRPYWQGGPEGSKGVRYTEVYRHPSSDKYMMVSDGTWSHMVSTKTPANSDGKEVAPTYRLEGLVKVWKSKTKHALEVPADELALCTYRKNFREAVEALHEFETDVVENANRNRRMRIALRGKLKEIEDQEERVKLEEQIGHLTNEIIHAAIQERIRSPFSREGRSSFPSLSFEREWSRWNFMNEIFKPGILDGSLEDECTAFSWATRNLAGVANPLQPMHYHGPQDGNYHVLKELGKVTTKIANDNIRQGH